MKMDVKFFAILTFFLFIIPNTSPYENRLEATTGATNLSNLPNILYVGGSGPGNYTTIRDAINAASNGGTIFVYSGIYEEHITIRKSIKLVGENKETTIIDASHNGTCIKVYSSNVMISNFTIRNAGNVPFVSSGIYISAKNVEITNCNISNNEYFGIWMWYPENISVKNCIINSNSWEGVAIDHGYNISIEKCKLYDNGDCGIGYWGVWIKIENCDIANSKGFAGISGGGFFAFIESCKIHDNAGGIDMELSFFTLIKNCDIYGNGCGIGQEFSAFTFVNKCSIHDNEEGVIIGATAFNFFHKNDFVSNEKDVLFFDSFFNLWLRNYWDKWCIPLPKPIFGIIFGFAWKGKDIEIPWIEFDLFPRIFH